MNLDRFVGIPYSRASMDCADLALLVQKELFAKEVFLPGKRPRPRTHLEQDLAIKDYSGELADKVLSPADGDVVLMSEIGAIRPGHIGTYFFINYTPYVLHTTALLGHSALHKLQELSRLGLTVEGYYRWK